MSGGCLLAFVLYVAAVWAFYEALLGGAGDDDGS